MALTLADFTIGEGNNFNYRATLERGDGTPIALASIVSATLSLCDAERQEIINGRDEQDILNANDVTIAATSGLLEWEMQPADNVIVTEITPGELESHIATFTIVFDVDNEIVHEREILVRQIAKIPATP